MAAPADKSALSWSEVATPIAALLARIEGLVAHVAGLGAANAALRARVGMLEAENAALKAGNAALRETLGRPPPPPDNSGAPPSRGHKANGAAEARRKGKVHAGAHRPLHPEPTRRRDVFAERCPHCRAAAWCTDRGAGALTPSPSGVRRCGRSSGVRTPTCG